MPPDGPSPYLFLCNGAKLTSRKQLWKSANAQELTTGKGGSVEVKIKDIYRHLEANVSARAADLIEIAACVYVADQMAFRSGNKTIDYGDQWYRHFRFEISVRDPDFWTDPQVTKALAGMLSFLSDDTYEFAFSECDSPSDVGDYLNFRATDPNPEGIDRVVMFSGGLDSLGGAIESILVNRKKVTLVSHSSVGHIKGIQKTLVDELRQRAQGLTTPPTHVPVWAHKRGLVEVETTQRSRSFLYVALGAVVANLYGLHAVDFYENGVVSVNLPLAQHTLGGRATRTTHPQTMAWFSSLLTQVFEKPFQVRNDFFGYTKQDVVEQIEQAGTGDLIDKSISCTHTRNASHPSPHCGLCSQCLSRRFATLGVNGGKYDSATRYRADVLTAPRPQTEDRILTERFLGQAQQIERMKNSGEFQRAFALEMARITPYRNGNPSEVIDQIFDLHKKHATQVGDVIRGAMKANVDALHHGTLPESCPVMLAFNQSIGKAGNPVSGMATATNRSAQFVDAFKPSRDQLIVMRILQCSTSLKIQLELEADTKAEGHGISRKTLSKILRNLEAQGLIKYPQGRNKGADLTPAGRQLLSASASH